MTESLWPADHLSVRLKGSACGALRQRHGVMRFAYNDAWLAAGEQSIPISQSLPLQTEPHEGQKVEAFFGNLLPEGDVRTRITRALQISLKNDYALLEAIGGDCAGALSLERPGVRTEVQGGAAGSVLDADELARLAGNLPLRPLLVGESGVRLSLAGAQNKLALCNAGGHWVKPAQGGVTTHILKPPIRDLEGSVENEAFCMLLAKRCHLGVPDCWIESSPHLYVVERYDRRRNVLNGRVERLHQEDFCQALGVSAANKYEAEGGPGLKDCFELVRKVSSDPAGDLLRLLNWVIFNVVIGNHDAHAKNLSFLYESQNVRLAPFYDLLCTAIYPGLSKKWAMQIGGAKKSQYFAIRHWRTFAKASDLNSSIVTRTLKSLSSEILKQAQRLRAEVAAEDPTIERIVVEVERNNRRIQDQIHADDTLLRKRK